jgi:hypothetical protein
MYKLRKKKPAGQPKPRRKKILLIIAACILLAAGAIAALELTDKTYFFHDKNLVTSPTKSNRTAGQETKGEKNTDADKDPSPTDTSKDPGTPTSDKTPSTNETAVLKTPTGTFVSNHRPKLSGPDDQKTMQSICVTTPGASCTIILTSGNITKSLPIQATDKEGAAYWTWSLGDLDITGGKWNVQAKATLGSQTKTATDPIQLEVQQ